MDYKILNTTDSQALAAAEGDTIHAELAAKDGCLSFTIQKGDEEPFYVSEKLIGSQQFELESNLLLSQAKQLYHITPLREITTGYSGDSIFEAESGLRRRILRVAEFSNKKEAHVEFETRWTEYLALRMEGIAKPVRSVNNRLYEVAGAGGKTYILSLQEKAPGKIVDINDPKEFNEELFFQLGMLMGRMHKLTMCYEGNQRCPEFKWNGPHFWRRNIAIPDEAVRQGEKRFLEELEQLPIGNENYGIVHFDIHTDNFLVEN